MSPDNELLFTHSDSLLVSDFGNLTEFDNFPKDLFLSNAIEEIADGGLLGELDSKDNLKPLLMCDIDGNAFGTPLKDSEDGLNSMKEGCSPFSMFMDEATSEPLEYIDEAPKLDSSSASDNLGMQRMGLSSTIKHTPLSGALEEGGLSSHLALLAANELNCMSLDELELSLANAKNALCAMSPRSSLQAPTSITPGNGAKPASPLTPLSLFGKASMNGELFRREALCPSSAETAAPTILQINSPVTSPAPSSKTSLSSSDGGALINLMLRGEDASSLHVAKGSLPQMGGVVGMDAICRTFNVADVIQSHSPSIQRSQSSHALGQLRIAGACVDPCNEDFKVLPSCKKVVPLSSNASTMSLFSPYQLANTQGLSGSSSVGPIRRVYSTGDLQVFHEVQHLYGGSMDNMIAEEGAGVKIGHYTKEERKMKLRRYRQKRTERNFSKKIKYACRKTLADSRPRVRGRFARTDEMGDSSLRCSDLPLIDEYEEVTSHHPARLISDQQTYLMANGSCMMSSNAITQFWNMVGMKVAM